MAFLFMLLKSKYTWYVVLAILIGIGLRHEYNSILDTGIAQGIASEHKKLQPQIDEAKAAQLAAEKRLKLYKDSYTQWVADAAVAKVLQNQQQKQIVDDLSHKLKVAEQKYRASLQNQKEVERYVTAKADAKCVVPVGFVRMFNESAMSAGGVAELSASGSTDVDAASGVDLSAVAQAAAANNAQAMYWRSQVIAWQSWYKQSYSVWQNAVNKVQNNVPSQ